MFLFINGVFFQALQHLGVAMTPDGSAAVIQTSMFTDHFFGRWMFKNGGFHETGEMWDKYGKSVLTNVKFFPSYIEPRIFSFDKRYLDRDYAIKYRFTRRNGNVWVGTYESRPTGKCVSRCVLTEVTGDDFFDNTAAIEMVSKQEKSSRKGDEKKSHSKNHTS